MADGLLSQINASIEVVVAHAAKQMFSGKNSANADAIRWEGMSNGELAAAIRLLNDGPGASGVQQAAQALNTIATNLQQIDQTLHTQLQAIGINWQSTAGELAQEMTDASAAYSGSASAAGGANSTGVTNQGDAFAAAKNAVPTVSDLQSPPTASFLDAAGATLTGHTADNAQQVSRSKQARQQAIDALNTYGNNSQSGIANHQPLPPPPGYGVSPSAPAGGSQVTTVSSAPPPPVTVPSGGGGTPGFPGSGGVPGPGGSGGNPGFPGVPGFPGAPGGPSGGGGLPPGSSGAMPGMPGPGAPGAVPGEGGLPGVPGTGGGVPAVPGVPIVGVPGPGGGGAGPLAPGPVSGVGPATGPGEGAAAVPAAQAGAASGALIEDAAVGAAIVGGTAGAGIAGASARPDRLVRSRLAGEDVNEGSAARQQTARALAELEGDEAEAAVVSERIGATAEPPPTLLEPAVVGRRPEDDEAHDTRYGMDANLFEDDRMVVPPVLDGSAGDADPTESK